ncbi:uncharacterized protein LOC108917761 [Anoplophora glabripennis]|uniref:uncharacterized protein LOC108917761 n=1 Tax=Anoplophora glabripennis TaxID=217634 RepID=UPI0008749852|nr:uncharacterized protein LOC108917761 [Anoplophora glabripennis]
MARERRGSYKSGYWIWDEMGDELLFVSRDSTGYGKAALPTTASIMSQITTQHQRQTAVSFKDTVGTIGQLEFRKIYQRKVKLTEPDVVTIQDIKDVVIFTCDVTGLTPEFISYFHSEAMDRFLRSLIIYFQYYFQVWNALQLRRKEAKRKLRQPIVTLLENRVRDDLSDMRSMVARDYAIILLGIGDAKKFHHMNNQNNESFSDRDRRLFEPLVLMATRVVWIALCRRYLSLIEKELNRLLRTKVFSPYEHKLVKNAAFNTTPEEDRILMGKACRFEQKLLHRSPAIQEIILDNHDYRMLSIGVTDIHCDDRRQVFLEAAYSAPEEQLEKLQVPVGILGIPRKYFDPMLKPRELSTTRRMSTMRAIPDFILPPLFPYDTKSDTLPKGPTKYQETEATKEARKKQCQLWRQYVEMGGPRPTEVSVTLTSSIVGTKTSRI